jgi:hydroxymethylbilane synthase
MRGNVPTRVAKLRQGEADGVILAAAGLDRLGIDHRPRIDLPVDRFVPAPAQGALAVQTRDNEQAAELVSTLDDAPGRAAVQAERSFLRGVNAGCHTPAAALARADEVGIALHAQLFSDDGRLVVEARETGSDARGVGLAVARRLLSELKDAKEG